MAPSFFRVHLQWIGPYGVSTVPSASVRPLPESGETVKHESGYSGVGFYHLKNSDGNVSAMLFTVQESRGLSGSGNLYVGRFMR
jgi:hypothetical protein